MDYWAQENGQVRGKQVCRLSETVQETPTTSYGSTAKFAGSSRISSNLEHSYGHVWATAGKAEPENTPRRPGSKFHLELVTDKSAEAFLTAFRRFACLRGHPNVCWSDRGSNFVGAQEYLREVMQNLEIPKIQSTLPEESVCDFEWQLPKRGCRVADQACQASPQQCM